MGVGRSRLWTHTGGRPLLACPARLTRALHFVKGSVSTLLVTIPGHSVTYVHDFQVFEHQQRSKSGATTDFRTLQNPVRSPALLGSAGAEAGGPGESAIRGS